MRVMHDRVAAIGVHEDMVKVAVRVPGGKRGKRRTDVLEFRTFYGVRQEMGRELRRRGVTHVVMGASGVDTGPVYCALAGLGFTEVMVISPSHLKALKGHKTGARDAGLAAGGVRVRAAAGLLPPGAGADGGAGPGQIPGHDGAGPHPARSSGCRKRWKRPGSSCPWSCPMLAGPRPRR